MIGSRPDPGARTLLLGVGCQKGGTTWLQHYLSGSPQVATGYLKEYHVFDSLDLPSEAQPRGKWLEKARQAARRLERGEDADAGPLLRAAFVADPSLYFDYCADLLARPGTRVTTDITPSYSGLSAERFASIRDEFGRRGVEVRVVFLLRDPVERIWSSERMYSRRRPGRAEGSAEDRLLRTYANGFHESRTRYHDTMTALEQVFPADHIYYGLYESLFEEPSLRRLCDFAGIDYLQPDLELRLNPSPKQAELSEATVREIATHYREVYDVAAERFGDALVADRWPGYQYVR